MLCCAVLCCAVDYDVYKVVLCTFPCGLDSLALQSSGDGCRRYDVL